MKERWDEAINKIDEKYIAEAAETHAKHVKKQLEIEQFDAEASHPTEYRPPAEHPKKSRKGLWIGICSAAAALVLCIVGGSIMLRGADNPLNPNDTTDVTYETSDTETAESRDTIDIYDKDGVIEFNMTYKQGEIKFTPPEQVPWLGNQGLVGEAVDVSEDVRNTFVEELTGGDYYLKGIEAALSAKGYQLDTEKSYCNVSNEGSVYGSNMTLLYVNGDKEIIINFGTTDFNFNYHFIGKQALRLEPTSGISRLWSHDGNGMISISVGGLYHKGVPYYTASVAGETLCYISAKGCTPEEVAELLGRMVCRGPLQETGIEAFDIERYGSIGVYNNGNVAPLSDSTIGLFEEALYESSFIPVYNLTGVDYSEQTLRLYENKDCKGDYDVLDIHFQDVTGKYYYSITADKASVYFEISEESYNTLSSRLRDYAPGTFYATILEYIEVSVDGETHYNYSDPEIGNYYVQSNAGGIYYIHSDERFEIGDSVEVCYWGGVMYSNPMQVNLIWMRKAYNIELDDSVLIPVGEKLEGFDIDIYDRFFFGKWAYATNDSYEKTIDYSTDFYLRGYCGRLENGYYFARYGMAIEESEIYFIHTTYPNEMYVFNGVNFEPQQESDTIKMNTRQGARFIRPNNTVYADYRLENIPLNKAGEISLCNQMGYNFDEVYSSLFANFTDDSGKEWMSSLNDRAYVREYCPGTNRWYARIYLRYITVESHEHWQENYDNNVLEAQYFLHTIIREGDSYVLASSVPCDEFGKVLPDAQGMVSQVEMIEDNDSNQMYNVYLDYCSTPYKDEQMISDISLRISYPRDAVIHTTHISSPGMWSDGGSHPKDFEMRLEKVELADGDVIAVLHSAGTGENRSWFAMFYGFDETSNLLRLMGDGFFFGELSSPEIITKRGSNIVTFPNTEGGMESYEFDIRSFRVKEVEYRPENMPEESILMDTSRADVNSYRSFITGWHTCPFMGRWADGSNVFEISLYNTEMFSYADPCLGWYEDNNGYYMCGETRLWYISKSDETLMYYFEDVKSGDRLTAADCTKVYRFVDQLTNFYSDEGEMGYIGLLDFCYRSTSDIPIDIEKLFDIEFTDENGTRWVRTNDRSVDWGGMYRVAVNNRNACMLKMQNADAPGEQNMKYFSFYFTKTEDGDLAWEDEHYSFDMSVAYVNKVRSDLATDVKALHGNNFTIELSFYNLPDEKSYYAVRRMGRSDAEYLNEAELLFHNDVGYASGYNVIADIGNAYTAQVGNRMFVLHSKDTDDLVLWVFENSAEIGSYIIGDVIYTEIYRSPVTMYNSDSHVMVLFNDGDMPLDLGNDHYVICDALSADIIPVEISADRVTDTDYGYSVVMDDGSVEEFVTAW
ncbi:MAG: hypothetical protein IJZ95_04570 [Oscillospiraceae bacterium]|nr:hypothetical protein [Oscillospiraceae bacterium]